MSIINFLFALRPYAYLIVALSALLGGEELLLFFSILSGQGFLSFWKIFVLGFVCLVVADCFWFLFARSGVYYRLKTKHGDSRWYKHTSAIVSKFHFKNNFITLFLTKFLIGLRITTIIRMSHKKMRFLKFIAYDYSALLLWAAIVLSAGWLAGFGFSSALSLFKDLERALLISLGVAVLFYIIEKLAVDRIIIKFV